MLPFPVDFFPDFFPQKICLQKNGITADLFQVFAAIPFFDVMIPLQKRNQPRSSFISTMRFSRREISAA